jgi:hypothetical protein
MKKLLVGLLFFGVFLPKINAQNYLGVSNIVTTLE